MLQPPTPYPYAGSYALLEHEGRTQLARILYRREGEFVISLPLKADASGNLRVDPADLIDGTPLTAEETREFHDLDRALVDRSLRTPRQKRQLARRDALKSRMVWSRFLDQKLRELEQRRASKAA